MFSSATDGKLESERYRLGRVNNGLSDKKKMTFVVCRMADTASVMFCQQDFLRKNKKKRDAGYSALAPDVLLEIYRHSAITGREAYVTKGNIPYNRSDGRRRYKGKERHAVPP